MLLTAALAAGVNIAWWKRALRGATLNDLHRHWLYGDSIWAALFSWKHINRVAVATVLVAMTTLLDGPLLQRASSVTSLNQESPKNMSMQIATLLPKGFTGLRSQWGGNLALLTEPFTQVVLNYSNRVALAANISGCEGSCDLTVQGVGLSTECRQETLRTDYTLFAFGINGTNLRTSYEKHTVFNITFGFQEGNSSVISMNSTYANNTSNGPTSCSGLLITNLCTLRPAVVEYQLRIENNGSRTQLIPSAYPRMVSVTTYLDHLFQDSTIGGIYLAVQELFTSQASISLQQNREWNIESSGALMSRYLHMDRSTSSLIYQNCNLTFGDPTSDILTALNEIIFRTALVAATSADTQSVQGMQTSTTLVLEIQYEYMVGACGMMLLGVVAICCMLQGWWDLGRDVSMSPLATAKAFNAPFLNSTSPSFNADIDTLLRDIGGRRVRYGEVRLGASNIGQGNAGAIRGMRRLEMNRPDRVRAPNIRAL